MQESANVLVALRNAVGEWGKQLSDKLEPFDSWVKENHDSIRVGLAYSIVSMDALAKLDSDYVAVIDNSSVIAMIERGWYPHKAMSSIQFDFYADALSKSLADANSILVGYYRDRVSEIRMDLVSDFPNRAKILNAAFDAHERGEVQLSVPVLLTQADGIWLDGCQRNLFSGGTEGALKGLSHSASNDVTAELTTSLLNSTWPLVLSESKRGQGFSEMNRHQVLHGESVSYDTEENSLKAIAFLSFVAFITS